MYENVRTLRTFQVFRAAHELDAGEQGYTAGQQHREASQVHVPLAAGVCGGRVPSETEIPAALYELSTFERLPSVSPSKGNEESPSSEFKILLAREVTIRASFFFFSGVELKSRGSMSVKKLQDG